jgi:hypothetical protein
MKSLKGDYRCDGTNGLRDGRDVGAKLGGMLNLTTMKAGFKVVKIDVMHPFYIGCHVGVHLNASVVFVRMKEGKSLVIFKLPLL